MNSKEQKIGRREQIIDLRDVGHSVSSIAREMGLSRKTVSKWLQRWEESGNVFRST